MHPQPDDILKRHAIRSTDCRDAILSRFLEREVALSQPDLEKALGETYDRVTIYRSLSLFLEKGILHKVLDDSGATKYALCKDTCDDHGHRHEHVHFKCVSCGDTHCIESVELPHFHLPQGYRLQEMSLLAQGICPACNSR